MASKSARGQTFRRRNLLYLKNENKIATWHSTTEVILCKYFQNYCMSARSFWSRWSCCSTVDINFLWPENSKPIDLCARDMKRKNIKYEESMERDHVCFDFPKNIKSSLTVALFSVNVYVLTSRGCHDMILNVMKESTPNLQHQLFSLGSNILRFSAQFVYCCLDSF